jgi:hypothetical protein
LADLRQQISRCEMARPKKLRFLYWRSDCYILCIIYIYYVLYTHE